MNSFLPAVPFLHSGYEIGERYPINTGLDFTPELIRQLPSERLPLFSEHAYNWLNPEEFTQFIRQILVLRKRFEPSIVDRAPSTFHVLETDDEKVLAYGRGLEHGKRVAVIGNASMAGRSKCSVRLDTKKSSVHDLLMGKTITVQDGRISCELLPGECVVFEY